MNKFVPAVVATALALSIGAATMAPVAASAAQHGSRNCIWRVDSPGAYMNASGVFYFEAANNELWGKGPSDLYSYEHHVWGNISPAVVHIESCDP
ncbi:hypothetical protein GCM10009765_51820 [Fodinicola feengrottensis]|uniref:Uncharacterized protein n=1 Tax=Fodinicola feengrottensis TaxID=435914 RepID=A0ABN2HZN0_9ACTN